MSSEINVSAHENNTTGITPRLLILSLWNWRKLILLSTVVAAVVSAIITLILPEEYESTSTVLVMPPPFKEVKDVQQEQIGLFPRPLGVLDYALLLQQDSVLLEVINKVNEKGILKPDQFESLCRPSVFREKMQVEVKVNEKTAYGTKHSPAILLTARGPSAEIARALAQAWAEIAEQKALELYKKSKSNQAQYILEQFDDVRNQLTTVLENQEKNEAAYNPDEFKMRLNAMTELYSEQENEFYKTSVEVKGLQRELENLQARLAEEQRVITLFNSPPMTAVFLDAKLIPRSSQKPESEGTTTLGFWSEQLNPVYISTTELVIQRAAQLAAKEERLKALEQNLQELKKSIDEYRTLGAQLNRERKQLEKEESVFSKSYLELANRYQQAKIAEAEEQAMADLRLVADAVTPDKKVAPMRTFIVAAATLLAFFASSASAVGNQVLKTVLQQL